eukprot:7259495-Alexandrium_andersonii.AAC.1
MAQLALAIRRLSPGKATGEDGIPAEALRAAPAEVAALLHPLAAKIALYAAEPVAWKGGLLHPIYKGKGPPAECAGSRAV